MTITFACEHCSNPFSLPDEHAGKKARCKNCNNVIQIPAANIVSAENAVCPGCSEPVLPNWNNCPSCQTPLPKQQPAGQPPLVQAGNDNVIKTTINAPTQSSGHGGAAGSASPSPAISMGDGNVVKANIDQSTNITHDKSVNVQGQYVAQQTVVNESNVGAILNLLSSPFTNKQADEISNLIEAIPDDHVGMMELLRKSLMQLVRQMKMEYKEAKNTGFGMDTFTKSYGKFMKSYFSAISFGMLDKVWSKKDIAAKRIELCKKILDKLHDSAVQRNHQNLMVKLETLDDHLISLQSLNKKNNSLIFYRLGGAFFGLGFVAGLLMGITGNAEESFGAHFGMVGICALASGGLFFYSWKTQKNFESEIKTMEQSVPQLLGAPESS